MAAGRDKKKLLGGGVTIRIGRDMLCLPYAGFFNYRTPLDPPVRASQAPHIKNIVKFTH